ncbi:Uncharacterized protein YbiU [Grifola frondosa]|uniref:Uncharacterized protein YbiU n=1 Tax=Grifola frondosa TaxID=5627 RepID=A0A1C7LYY6_GRIFR|nr:Uncharacterized protein YbiU [Grifola frondosa]
MMDTILLAYLCARCKLVKDSVSRPDMHQLALYPRLCLISSIHETYKSAHLQACSTLSTDATGTRSSMTGTLLHPRRAAKKEGTIMDVFTSLTDEAPELPARFAELKRSICKDKDAMVCSWNAVLKELETAVEEVAERGADIIPSVSYSDVMRGLSAEQVNEIKRTGVVIVRGGVPREEALGWKQSIKDYIQANVDKVKGIPPDNIVFYEIYNSPAQILARTHPALIATQRALLSLWHCSSPDTQISLRTPLAYFDRLRIRPPGPSVFTLGPHIDGGSVERWEDPGFRACFARILEGNWRAHDPFDASPRIHACQDLYNTPNHAGTGEGTLRVLPFLKLSSAYTMLRPFFRLGGTGWELDLESTEFPGSVPGKAQELRGHTHPHLQLDRSMVSIPRVEPGDQVYWHCDVVHAVEAEHNGVGDSSVLYIPAVPLTEKNAAYLRDQRENFVGGRPPPDFPGGEGESRFAGRGSPEGVSSAEGRRMLGLEPFECSPDATAAEVNVIEMANTLLS